VKVIYAYNRHRGVGGADNTVGHTRDAVERHGVHTEIFTRSSADLPPGLRGRMRAGLSAVYAPGSARAFAEMLDRSKPDLVHIHEVFPLVSPWILPECTRRGVPVVMTCVDYRLTCPVVTHFHDGDVCTRCTGGREHWAVLKNCRGNLPESITAAVYSKVVRCKGLFRDHVTQYIAPSEFARHWLIDRADIDPERITTVSPVVEIPDEVADPAAGTYAAFPARFTREKGMYTVLAARKLCDAPIRFARHELSLAPVELPPDADLVITRSKDDLNAFMSGARMSILASIWMETFGLVGAEAMAIGLPLIASRIGAASELVEDGVDGLLFEHTSPEDLADKIMRLWSDSALARRLGRAAREKAVAIWHPDRHVERLMTVYEAALSAGAPR
jgi:glycosyltransferase involved in cell wall biosynthesis